MIACLARRKLLLIPLIISPLLHFHYSKHNAFFRAQSPIKKQNLAQKPEVSHSNNFSSSSQSKALPLEVWGVKIRGADTLEQLQLLADAAFSHQSTHLAMYLRCLYPHLTMNNFHNNRAFFTKIDQRINSFAANLTLTAQEFLQMLRFHSRVRGFDGEMNFLHNFGFEKRASILAATFMHNRELSIGQAVQAMTLILPLGGVNMLLYINFIKFFKEVAYGKQAEEIRLQHLLALLNLKFLKRNDIILENILYDQALYFLLQHLGRLMTGKSLTLRVELFCTLVRFDIRNSYRADASIKRHRVQSLLRDVEGCLDSSWVRELWVQEGNSERPRATQVVYMLECIAFAKKKMLDYESMDEQYTIFAQKCLQLFEKECEQLQQKELVSEASIQLLFRFVFNPYVCNLWMKRKTTRELIFGIIIRNNVTREQTVDSLTGLINSEFEDYQIKLRLLQLAKAILTKHMQQNIVLHGLTLAFIQRASNDIAKQLLAAHPQLSADPLNSLFLNFARCCYSDTDQHITNQPPANISKFINDIYKLALFSQSQRGYEVALAMMEEHFTAIRAALLPQGSKEINRSELNSSLSEEAYYVGWIIFVNLSNGRAVSSSVKAYFEALLTNDIIKYSLLSDCYVHSYPHPTRFDRPTITSSRTYNTLKFIKEFFAEEKYAYFVWDVILKRLAGERVEVREECLPLIESSFLEAFRKENLRKVVMVTVLSSHMAAGVIVGPRRKLQGLLEQAVDELVVSEELIEHHYNCYLLIVGNALAADVLSPLYFDKLMLHSLKKDPQLRHTCSLMLLYGASLRTRNEVGGVISPEVVYEQGKYLKFLIKNNYIVLPHYSPKLTSSKRTEVQLSSKLLAILFSFGVREIVNIEKQVYAVLQGGMDFGEWRCVVNCYTAENYSMQLRREAEFRGKVNQLLIGRLIRFRNLGLISRGEENYFIDKFK